MKNSTKIILYLLYLVVFLVPVAFCPKLYNAFELFKISILQYVVITIYFIWLLGIIKSKRIFLSTTFLDLILFFWFFIFFLSLAFSEKRYLGVQEFTNFAVFLLFYFALSNFSSPSTKFHFLYLIIFSASCISLYGILQHFKIDFVYWDDPVVYLRGASTLGNPNFIAGYLCLSLPLILGLILFEKKYIPRGLLIFVFLVNFICLLYTFGRGGWLGAVLSFVIILILVGRKVIIDNKYILIFLAVLFGLTIYFISREKITFDDREQDLITRSKSIVELNYPSTKIRKHLWSLTLDMIGEKPILGWGPETFSHTFFRFRHPELSSLAGRTNIPESAHNEYLQIAQSAGLGALFLFLWLVIYTLFHHLHQIKKGIENKFNIVIFSSLFAFYFSSLFYYKISSTFLVFFTLLALSNTTRYKTTKEIKMNFSPLGKTIIIISSLLIYISVLLNTTLPLYADYHFQKGVNYFYQKNYNKAIEKYSLAYTIKPQNKDYSVAIPMLYEHLISVLPDDESENKYRKIYFLEKAEKDYQKILKAKSDDPFIWASLARVYFLQGQYQEKYLKKSIKHYQKAISLDPYNCLFYNDLGLAYLKDNQILFAQQNFQKAIKLDSTFDMPYANLGVAYFNQKDNKMAKKWFKKAHKINPKNHQFLHYLGLIYLEEKNYPQALSTLQEALLLAPYDASIKHLIELTKKKIKK